jgi:hypothetical protein
MYSLPVSIHGIEVVYPTFQLQDAALLNGSIHYRLLQLLDQIYATIVTSHNQNSC